MIMILSRLDALGESGSGRGIGRGHNSRMPLVRVSVTLKPQLLDSAGRTVASALGGLGFGGVQDVRIGKLVELKVDEADDATIRAMCDKLLANPVIEEYRYEVID